MFVSYKSKKIHAFFIEFIYLVLLLKCMIGNSSGEESVDQKRGSENSKLLLIRTSTHVRYVYKEDENV